MITQENTNKLTEILTETFPGKNPKFNNKAGGGAYGVMIVVESIDKGQLSTLNTVSEDLSCKVDFKRSGTGISIHFN